MIFSRKHIDIPEISSRISRLLQFRSKNCQDFFIIYEQFLREKLCFLISISLEEDVFQIIRIKIKTSCTPVALHSSLPLFDVTSKQNFVHCFEYVFSIYF